MVSSFRGKAGEGKGVQFRVFGSCLVLIRPVVKGWVQLAEAAHGSLTLKK